MVLLQNDVTTASERATALANGVSSLSSSGTVSKDEQTKLGGNDVAKAVIEASQGIAREVDRVISNMSSSLKGVSQELQAMDQTLGKQLDNLEKSYSTGFTINGTK
ncbi:TIGR04197 family type VII secretion effector [Streptococcus ruminantium]|uniref:TIGR04197 family type VII secretion effector n=1 Tax=Streptococcus ruminantium TaxID=1917441 RepID=UPI0012DD3A3D|nr:TIGR04197 family type VII secretion effector [Streptococcus ruminantium]